MLQVIFENVINTPGRTALLVTLAIGVILVVIGLVLSFRKWMWLGRGLGFLGLCVLLAALLTIHEQTTTEKKSESVTVKRFRHSERTRSLVLVGMIGLSGSALAVMWFGFNSVRRRLRREVPRRLKAGRRHFAQKEFEPALREYNQVLQATPHLAAAYSGRGSVYLAMGKTAEALTDFDLAIQYDPRLAAAYLERGKLRTANGDLDGALADFSKLMMIRANDPDTYLQRGICLVKKGLINEAMADFHRVLKLTNHSDFAEPAKNYLRQHENRSGWPGQSSGNGPSTSPASPQPRAQDHAF
jgi:hypothetical protein